jgi:ABC-type glutathione transport system ATPase component
MNNMNRIILKCENVSYEAIDENIFSNQKKVILENISFEVYENEILSIAGESGSGKTTLGKILSGVLKPNAGEIKYFFNQNNYDKNISSVQFLFQNNGELINPFRSVESVLREAIQKAGKNAFVKSVDELLRMFSLPESIKTQKGYTLSGGQQQRVALARILAVNPQLIILDEPFSAQDKESVDNLVSIIKKIRNDSGKSIICISHDIKVLKKISDRLLIMKDGKVVEIGDAQKIFSNPQNEFTKFLIKASELELTAEEVETFLKKYEQNQRNQNS